ncbi:MAG: class I SAM-dependent methyltransferase [Actinobacteria bacterium]|nr:class I SAM-dependent methyltransferase [Actinomycetota bacterium]MBU1944319.1 class I SAM-dependent methyltransferase [Actinomycetota bacterium]MBU2688304.1 class I SAM-dependent methyltransferase [Actinomycetota bacterium]
MSKQGEIEYLGNLGDGGARHAAAKPFSDDSCADNLMEIGAVMLLLPPPPARLLDLGCGSGWTSVFFARRGYEVTGVDIAPDMIELGRRAGEREGLDNVRFAVGDYESLDVGAEFDCAVFYDSLHHSSDERAALACAYRSLRTGGVCVTSEPGRGHSETLPARNAVSMYGVTERDMEPERIVAAGRAAGFRSYETYPHANVLVASMFRAPTRRLLSRVDTAAVMRTPLRLSLLAYRVARKRDSAIVALVK